MHWCAGQKASGGPAHGCDGSSAAPFSGLAISGLLTPTAALFCLLKSHDMAETLVHRATLKGHTGWVTAIAAPLDPAADTLLSASRDKTVLVWHLTRSEDNYGTARRALRGHSHFVQDVVISSDGQFCLSGSWDGTLRLWDLNSGSTTRRFIGHAKDVLSVAFSVDNRQVH